MPAQPLFLRIFLSSPGDVEDERKRAIEVLENLPYDPLLRDKLSIRIIAWDRPGADAPMLATMTPQEAINQGLPTPSECDIVIVILWSRLGTPLPHPKYQKPDGSQYLSGTEWEYLDAFDAAKKTGKPALVVYRRTEDVLLNPKDKDFDQKHIQWKRVQDFFAAFRNPDGSIGGGYNQYEKPEDFRDALNTHIRVLINNLLEAQPPADAPAAPIETPPLWQGSPFPGLRAFTPDDAPIFFGRGHDTDALIEFLKTSRLVAIVGASGSGKSSLVGAGLLPRLAANAITGSKHWFVPHMQGDPNTREWVGLRMTPGEFGDNPFMALGVKLRPFLQRDQHAIARDLYENPASITDVITPLLPAKKHWAEALLFIDQFEELFTLVHPQYVPAFITLLETITASERLRVVLTLRADFYARCVEYPALAALLKTGTFPLAAASTAALHQMISRPAERAGLAFAEGLVERILRDTGDDAGALPLLAYALDELYRIGRADRIFTHDEYDQLGGVQGAIGERADAIFSDLAPAARNALPDVFREIVEVDERGVAIRRRAGRDAVTGTSAAQTLTDALTNGRLLLQTKDESGAPVVEVAHEALLRRWERLTNWIEGQEENLRLRTRIERSMTDWKREEQDDAFLLRGVALEQAQDWLTSFPASTEARAFIDQSAKVEARRQARERFQAQLAAVSGLVAAIAIIAVIMALLAAANARDEQTTAQTQEAEARAVQASVEWQATYYALGQARAATLAGSGVIMSDTGSTPQPPEDFIATLTQVADLNIREPLIEADDFGVDMVHVPAGCFIMGSIIEEAEQPAHEICFDTSFWIDRYEVTNQQFERLAGVAEAASGWPDPDQPRTDVTWFEAGRFCAEQRQIHLPTEAQWEYAARGPNSRAYPWGNQFDESHVVYYYNASEATAIGENFRSGGTSWVGAYDMGGNVWEWTSTKLADYPYDATDGREDLDDGDSFRMIRGGSFRHIDTDLRAAKRGWYEPNDSRNDVGFRCARSE